MKSIEELRSVYEKTCIHYLPRLMVKFHNMIDKDPFSELTQKKALFYEKEMATYHSEVIADISNKNYDYNEKGGIFPCKCLKNYIKERVKEFENNKDMHEEYKRWLKYDK